jgi:hypothetical protein
VCARWQYVRAVIEGRQGLQASGGERRPFDVRRAALGSIGALLGQFLLGLAASLWVTIGPVDPWSHIDGAALLAVHGLFGVALAAMALVTLSRTLDAPGTTRLWAGAAALGILVALVCGLEFVSTSGGAGWSFAMGCGWAVALFADVRLALGG